MKKDNKNGEQILVKAFKTKSLAYKFYSYEHSLGSFPKYSICYFLLLCYRNDFKNGPLFLKLLLPVLQ